MRVVTLELAEQNIDLIRKDIGTIGELLINGKVSLATWEQSTAAALKKMHVQSYVLGRGGQKMMTQRDYGIISAKLRKEYRYLDQFTQDIKSGMSEAQFRARLQQYLSNGRTTVELARREGHAQAGYEWERRRLAPVQNCDPCIGYAQLGWRPLNSLPGIGENCDCRANCKCSFEFSNNKPDSLNLTSRLTIGFGWLQTDRRWA